MDHNITFDLLQLNTTFQDVNSGDDDFVWGEQDLVGHSVLNHFHVTESYNPLPENQFLHTLKYEIDFGYSMVTNITQELYLEDEYVCFSQDMIPAYNASQESQISWNSLLSCMTPVIALGFLYFLPGTFTPIGIAVILSKMTATLLFKHQEEIAESLGMDIYYIEKLGKVVESAKYVAINPVIGLVLGDIMKQHNLINNPYFAKSIASGGATLFSNGVDYCMSSLEQLLYDENIMGKYDTTMVARDLTYFSYKKLFEEGINYMLVDHNMQGTLLCAASNSIAKMVSTEVANHVESAMLNVLDHEQQDYRGIGKTGPHAEIPLEFITKMVLDQYSDFSPYVKIPISMTLGRISKEIPPLNSTFVNQLNF